MALVDLKRTYIAVTIDEGQVRHKVRIEDGIETVKGGQSARVRQAQILDTIAATSELTHCGPAIFDEMKIYHDGAKWVIEAEAIVSAS